MALIVHQIAVGGFDNNFSYLIVNTFTKEALVVDPSGDFYAVSKFIDEHDYKVLGVLITHTHADHIDKLSIAVTEFHTPNIYVHNRGASVSELAKYEHVIPLEDNSLISLGESHIKVIYTPGHTDDAICFYIESKDAEDRIPKVITGDTLFVGGCGRTNEQRVKDLYESLAELSALPEETVVYPGHNYGDTPTSTIGQEKMYNKYYQVGNFTEFQKLRLG